MASLVDGVGHHSQQSHSLPRNLKLKEKTPGSLSTAQPHAPKEREQFRGWLLKWTNYIKGYQKRWFVLSNGLLSYYRTQEEMAHTCRGTINLAGACIDTVDSTNFVVTNGASQVFHLRALNEVERQRWVTALELAKAKAIKNLEEFSDEDIASQSKEDEKSLHLLSEKLSEVTATHNLILQKHHDILKTLAELDDKELAQSGSGSLTKLKEKIAMFKITSSAMAKVSEDYLLLATSMEKHWLKQLQHEKSLRAEIQENFETLAKQMHSFENQARRVSQRGGLEDSGTLDLLSKDLHVHVGNSNQKSHLSSSKPHPLLKTSEESPKVPGGAQRVSHAPKKGVTFDLPKSSSPSPPPFSSYPFDGREEEEEEGSDEDGDDDKFFDAPEADESYLAPPTKHGMSHKRTPSSISVNEAVPVPSTALPENIPASTSCNRIQSFLTPSSDMLQDDAKPTLEYRRKTISPRPNAKINLWTIMKNCIGKELTKIPMPVHFGEPLSFLQRISEDITYYEILNNAAACSSTLEEAAFVAAFAASSYESTAIRVNKPFNPMLGETFECDRRAEYGWRVLFEQVSHHPPMLAMHAEHKEWTLWQEYTLASKFRGKYIQCFPVGGVHLIIHRSGSHYTWNKVVTTIHNIIVGKLWVDNAGEMTVLNHTTKEKCEVKYHSYSYFTRERQRKITGHCFDKDGTPQYVVRGYWDEYLECAPILSYNGKNPVTGPAREMWRVFPRPPGSEAMYHFSEFTCSLNEMEDGVAPTDSRHRPDQRIMEDGDFDEANRVKALLEEKQRARRRMRESLQAKAAEAAERGNTEEAAKLEKEATYSPAWFIKEYDPFTNSMMHVYKGGYWECKRKGDWPSDLPDIYEL
ncbi:PREDICTED: oxysterol-binding protein 1-like [Amphimedon queenslandica]|uniref:PH domain-containing protein n=3 Tax=Amphimedon queenslandica TaxID=400682 RepID=A0A1X7UHF4_AMPQE|nr:PREDICTED: oxysterol-binding protein 1-like [Amphimedon queenslandica]|eukprot:XP_019854132.1 PREDICTED: oxysterol-binding protein 1-like [Amphimedon queenslandica]